MFDIELGTLAMNSARIFRVILDAMARPGAVLKLVENSDASSPLFSNTNAVIRTLSDFQSPLWLSPTLNIETIIRQIKFQTGAPVVTRPAESVFAILTAQEASGEVEKFNVGTDEYPDRSTTLLIQVDGFNNTDVELAGPGLKVPVGFGVSNLSKTFWTEMMVNHTLYPLGVDVIFISPESIACCPRSTSIVLKESC
jgi:alpha-D-ribose 1-methylphosphonate 5-triphosphate synthase subunit PhnH